MNTVSSAELNGKVGQIINDSEPDIIYTHHKGDINIDHRFVYEAVMVNTRPINKKISVFCFETVSSTEWSNESFTPNFYVNIENFLDRKIEMFYKYESEVKIYPHPRSRQGLITLSKKRGMDICTGNAEAFQVVRDFWM